MDIEKLIDSVHERRALWDKSDKMYHNRDAAKELWSEVCGQLGLHISAIESVKKRWNSLRDVFRREYQKVHKTEGSDTMPTWAYYQKMMFLSSQTRVRTTTNSRADSPESQEHLYDNMMAEIPFETMLNDAAKGRHRRTPSEEMLAYYETAESHKKMRIYESNFLENDESDYHFLMSLLPFLKSIPYRKKLTVRLKLQQILIDEYARTGDVLPSSRVMDSQYQLTCNDDATAHFEKSNTD